MLTESEAEPGMSYRSGRAQFCEDGNTPYGMTQRGGMNALTNLQLLAPSSSQKMAAKESYYRKLWIDDVMKKAAYPSV
jgi:hypothetical protein